MRNFNLASFNLMFLPILTAIRNYKNAFYKEKTKKKEVKRKRKRYVASKNTYLSRFLKYFFRNYGGEYHKDYRRMLGKDTCIKLDKLKKEKARLEREKRERKEREKREKKRKKEYTK